jgi:hypothetical protein
MKMTPSQDLFKRPNRGAAPNNPFAAGTVWGQFHRNGYAQASTPLREPEANDNIEVQRLRARRSPFMRNADSQGPGKQSQCGYMLATIAKQGQNAIESGFSVYGYSQPNRYRFEFRRIVTMKRLQGEYGLIAGVSQGLGLHTEAHRAIIKDVNLTGATILGTPISIGGD